MPEPLTAVGASINASFRLADFCLSVQRAPEDIVVFSQLIKRVGVDRAEGLQNYIEKESILNATPKKKEWIFGIIKDTDQVLERIGATVENARIDGVKGKSVSFQHRLEWVFSKKEQVLILQHWLSTCHQSLLGAINYMQGLQSTSTPEPATKTLSVTHEGKDEDKGNMLLSPYMRRPRKSASQLLDIAPPTYSRTLSEDLERAFRVVEALSLNQDLQSEQQDQQPEEADQQPEEADQDIRLPSSPAVDPHEAVEISHLAIPAQPERRPSVEHRRRRREAYLQDHGV